MATQAIRKRLSINKYQGREENMENTSSIPNPLREPLLLNDQVNINDPIPRPNPWDDKRNVLCHGICHLSQFIKYSARRIANLFVSIGSFLRRLFAFNFTIQGLNNKEEHSLLISPLQEERLQNLRHRLEVPFDASLVEHQDALRQLWRLAYPEREIPSLKSELWKEMGWQGVDPSTDIRGGGFISLENLIYFARTYPESFQRLLHKQDGVRSEWEYPFAAAGINISFMLAQMLELHSGRPTTKAGIHFLRLLGGDEMAFDKLYCVAFQLLDSKWLSKKATYMEFNELMKSTRLQLEQELGMNEIFTISDMPTFKMLK
ncbi:ELMO domain-containing protein C-like isoform X3 [Carex littledalei]|uniref:ELMO domain-containing protein C-like isoform X3 n=1 Tax=Carex littledalei TaxID=544730 RepID=A0A833R1N8_9POAL|nr:ELMO domain-containing protein C-like isoform X3 [Carex littledalei]